VEASREEFARFFSTVLPHLNEAQRRVVAGAMAVTLGHRLHLAVVGTGFLAVSVAFWIAKFVIYQRFIFPVVPAEVEGPGSTRPPGGRSSPTGPGRLGSHGT
jgi:hypothetical protein